MMTAYITIAIVLLALSNCCFIILIYQSYKKQHLHYKDRRINEYQLDILNETLSRDKNDVSLETLLDTIISSLNSIVSYDVCSYLLKQNSHFVYKAYVQEKVGANFVRAGEKIAVEKFIKKAKNTSSFEDLGIKEYISGNIVSTDTGNKINSYFSVDIKYRGKDIGVVLLSSSKSNAYVDNDKQLVSQVLTSSLFFLRKIQTLTGVGLISDEYINMVLHDLRTPLTVINGNSDILIKREKQLSKSDRLKIYKDIKHSAGRLSTIVNNLLDVARIEKGKIKLNLKNQDCVEFFKFEAESFRAVIEDRGLKYVVKFPKGKIVANFDKDVTARVLDNLISNAIKYTEKGTISVSLSKEKSYAVFSVKDSGIGISKKQLKRLFNKFEQIANPVDKSQKSTGLGLVISKKLVESQSGKIVVKSKLGQGSNFIFKLPLT